MAAKSINEAIDLSMCVGPLIDMRARLQNELKDFFAHKCQIYGYQNNCDDLMKKFFEELFKEVK